MTKHLELIPIAAIVTVALAGCGSSTSDANGESATTAPAKTRATTTTASVKGPKLKLVSSDYGRILADGHGKALYLFTADPGKASTCAADCATAWPPYIVKSRPTATSGAKPGRVGTARRSDGKLQATYAGHPVYYYEGDRQPGQVLCQAASEFGGYWYVLRGNGKAVH
jgi:predicted lipoprotein with Yx(FWY)xxD motif